MTIDKKLFNSIILSVVVIFGLLTIITNLKLNPAKPAYAATTYTVTTNVDSGAGSLRQAITDANANPGADVIIFNAAMTIQPLSALPVITDPVEINGYTGSPGGATPNTAVSPNPFNGTLTIEIDGQNAGAVSGLFFQTGSEGSEVKGLVINRFVGVATSGIQIGTDNVTVQGSYIGTNTTATTALANTGGIQQGADDSDNAQIGGTNPADRNIISGNIDCGSSPSTNSDNWVYEGNYIGPAADGTTALGNGSTSGCGGLSIDNNNGSRIGGTSNGTTNVISGNGGGGIQPDNTDGVVIQGNLIGTDYTGTAALPNGVDGVSFSQTNTSALVGGTTSNARNIISGNTSHGVAINAGGSNISVFGNYIGTDITGTQPLGNGYNNGGVGVRILGSSNCSIGSSTDGTRNIISANDFGVLILGTEPFGGAAASENKVQNNYIGTNVSRSTGVGLGNRAFGVYLLAAPTDNLIGGTTDGTTNVIAGNGSGIFNAGFALADVDLNNSFLGNSIYSNTGGPFSQLGIDLANTIDSTSFTNTGVTTNDAGDSDESTNHYMNFPVIQSVTSANGQATITYNLDINDAEPGATGYRVEFFANDSADPSGHGQGQTYIGSDTVAGDVTGRHATVTLPAGVEGTKYISAVTTMIDNSTDGFGHSSEFAADVEVTLVAATGSSNNNSLAPTGQNSKLFLLATITLILSGCITVAYTVRR